jgi:hypothetical protein
MARDLVIYHGKCPDGFGGALAAWLRLGDEAEYLPATHNATPMPDATGRRVWCIDFAPPREQLAAMARAASELIVLDHHKTALEDLAGWHPPANTILVLDQERSGAHLAWRHFHPETPLPPLLAHIEDRDLWRWALPDSRPFTSYLDGQAMNFASWRRILEFDDDAHAEALEDGRELVQRHLAEVDRYAAAAATVFIAGEKGLMAEAPKSFVSDVGHVLAKRSGTFGLVWRREQDVIAIGLRSVAPYVVDTLAQRFGGGGHALAAGFVLRHDQLSVLLSGQLNAPSRVPAP